MSCTLARSWTLLSVGIVALGCGGDSTAPPLDDVSGDWAGRVTTTGPLDSLALTLYQRADGTLDGGGTRVLFGIPIDLLVSGRRVGSEIELLLESTPPPSYGGPDTLRAQVGAAALRGEFVTGPFRRAIVLRRP